MNSNGGGVSFLIYVCLVEYESMAVCRLSQNCFVGKMLEMGQALDLQGYSQTILVFSLRD